MTQNAETVILTAFEELPHGISYWKAPELAKIAVNALTAAGYPVEAMSVLPAVQMAMDNCAARNAVDVDRIAKLVDALEDANEALQHWPKDRILNAEWMAKIRAKVAAALQESKP